MVSRGLCRNLLPRVFNPPELVALDLLPAEDKAAVNLKRKVGPETAAPPPGMERIDQNG